MSADPADESTAGGAVSPPGTARRVVTICNQLGLHARAARRFVLMAGKFDADVRVHKNGTEASGRDILDLLLLGAAPGTVIELTATGPQAEAAVTALADLIECKFDED